MSILAITVTKPLADSKLGFTCKVVGDSVVVTSVNEYGLFGGTDLRQGQAILRINGTSVQNIGAAAINALLRSLPRGDMSMIVKSKKPPTNGAIFRCSKDGARVKGQMKRGIDDMPEILKDASVPAEKWWLIYTLVAEELMPISLKCVQNNEIYNETYMKSYLKNQKSKYTDTILEKAVHMNGVQTGILHNNVTLVAMAVKDQINSLLAKYHVMAVLAYESIELPQCPEQKSSNHLLIAVGFNFHSMDYLTVCAVPTASVMEFSEPLVAAPVVPTPTAPTLDF